MQLGFLRIERPPDIQSYFPSYLLGKKISLSAESDVGLCPTHPQKFSEENLTKDFKPPLPRARQFISAL